MHCSHGAPRKQHLLLVLIKHLILLATQASAYHIREQHGYKSMNTQNVTCILIVYKQVWLSASEIEERKMMTECLPKYKRGFVAFSQNEEPEVHS